MQNAVYKKKEKKEAVSTVIVEIHYCQFWRVGIRICLANSWLGSIRFKS